MDNSPFPTSPTTSGTSGGVARGVDSAGQALHSGIDKMADPTKQAVDRMTSAAHDTVDKVASSASHAAQRMADVPIKAYDTSIDWVQQKPLEAVGIALAVGFVLGRLTAN
jgi:ElaB/YqjD/DUF883 family membrane-anchored ribosome-binding protein